MKLLQTHTALSLASILLAALVIGCGMTEMESRWRDRDIVIDGIDNGPEWEYARYFIDTRQVTLGIMNDSDALYLRLSSRDTGVQRQVLTGGLTIWFDETGEGTKTFGVRYPPGISASDSTEIPAMPRAPQSSGFRRGGRGGAIDTDAITKVVNAMIAMEGDDVDIIDIPQNSSTWLGEDEARKDGIEYAIGYDAGNLVYELRVPLHRGGGNEYGIAGNAGIDYVGVGFETGPVPLQEQARTGMPSEGNLDEAIDEDNDMLINPRGRTREDERIANRRVPELPPDVNPVDFWLKIHLASGK